MWIELEGGYVNLRVATSINFQRDFETGSDEKHVIYVSTADNADWCIGEFENVRAASAMAGVLVSVADQEGVIDYQYVERLCRTIEAGLAEEDA